MDYEELKRQVLAQNDLLEDVASLLEDDDQVVYLDRHAIEWSAAKYDPYVLNPETVKLGVMLALDLVRHWSAQRKSLTSIYASEPFLYMDEEWLLGRKNPAPPSARICLAKSEQAFDPVPFEGDPHRRLNLDSDIDLTGASVVYVEGYDDPEEKERLGAWLIRIDGEDQESR